MIYPSVVIVSVLSLLSFTWAATLHARQDCPFICPDTDLDGNALDSFSADDTTISCSYVGESFNLCTYDSTSGGFIGSGDCPDRAVQQCIERRGVPIRHANKRGEAPSRNAQWRRRGSPSLGPKRDVPTPTPDWPSYNPSQSKPKPSPTPPTQQPCKFKCPQQDLAKNPLTDEAFRDPFLFCSFSTPGCKICSFCKYNAKTGTIVEDNDDGNCPQTASVARPWDRRYI